MSRPSLGGSAVLLGAVGICCGSCVRLIRPREAREDSRLARPNSVLILADDQR
jgi:hypothetical protein